MTEQRIVIVGAGHAGGSVAALLRQYGFEGAITLIGDEAYLPYQRPPLSKAWLKGEAGEDDLQLRPEHFYEERQIEVRRRTTVTAINRAAKTVQLKGGRSIPYDKLILATGARARPLPAPGATLDGVFALRTADDAEALKAELTPGRRLIIVGGGYVGLEVAASARALGAEVTVIEREPRLLARVAGEALSGFFHQYHAARGVRFVLGGSVTAIEGARKRASMVVLDNGERLPCDAVLVGVGAIPNQELAQDAELPCQDGVIVDQAARTADPDIYAIGDVTRRPLPLYGRSFRLESVPSALELAKQAACDITGRNAPAPEVPWFWSDQYDLKLQIAGLPFEVDHLIVRGDPTSAHFAVFHMSGPVIQAVEAVNSPPEFMAGRQLIGARTPVSLEKLADPAVSMKEVAA